MLPFIEVFGVNIPMYGICVSMGIMASGILSYLRIQGKGGDGNTLIILAASVVAAGFLSAKFFYLAFSYGIENEVRDLSRGLLAGASDEGFVFYGGFLGGMTVGLVLIWKWKLDRDLYLGAIIPTVPLAHALGRIGCACAGCCYGREYHGIFAVNVQLFGEMTSVFPVQILEAILNVILCVVLLLDYKKKKDGVRILILYGCIYAALRFGLEFLRGDLARGTFMRLSTSQWIGLAILLGNAVYLFRRRRTNARANFMPPI